MYVLCTMCLLCTLLTRISNGWKGQGSKQASKQPSDVVMKKEAKISTGNG